MTVKDRVKQVAAGCVASLAVVDAHVWLGNAGTDALPVGIAFGAVGLTLAAWLRAQRRRAMQDAERAIADEPDEPYIEACEECGMTDRGPYTIDDLCSLRCRDCAHELARAMRAEKE